MPAHKKHPSARARRNKTATAATLVLRETIDYSTWSLAELRAEIDERNEDGRETKLSKRGTAEKMAEILAADDVAPPELPERVEGWHPMTVRMWRDIWASPMSDEWDDSDLHNVYMLAAIYDDMWQAPTAKDRKDAAAEYRLQRKDLGLSPMARRSLEWHIEAAEDAKDKGKRRRERSTPPVPASQQGRPDPRAGLSAVK